MNMFKVASVGAILSLAAVMPNAYAMKNGQKFKAWTGECQKIQKQKFCAISQIVKNAEKKPMLQISVHKEKGQPSPIMSIMAPHGMAIQAGIGFSIDKDKEIAQVPYIVCNPVGCRAVFPVNKKLLAKLKKGSKMHVYMIPFGTNQEIKLSASLSGFTSGLKAL